MLIKVGYLFAAKFISLSCQMKGLITSCKYDVPVPLYDFSMNIFFLLQVDADISLYNVLARYKAKSFALLSLF